MNAENKFWIKQIGVCCEHDSLKINTPHGLPGVYEIVGVADDCSASAVKFAGDNL